MNYANDAQREYIEEWLIIFRAVMDGLNKEKEYYELIDVVKDYTRPNCKIKPKPGLFRGQVRRMYPPYVHSPYYAHPGYRPGWRRPSIRFNYIGEPYFIFRF